VPSVPSVISRFFLPLVFSLCLCVSVVNN
jgi:hypothetical protein